MVDIQNVNQQRVMTREVIDAIPSGRGIANYATLIPGVIMSNSSLNISQDVGGGTGFNFAFAAIHGGRALDQQIMVNGMSVTSLTGTGGTRSNWSDGTAQEYGILLAGHSGGDRLRRRVRQRHPPRGLQPVQRIVVRELRHRRAAGRQPGRRSAGARADRRQQDQEARGHQPVVWRPARPATSCGSTPRSATRSPTTTSAGSIYNLTPKAWTYTPDTSRPAVSDQRTYDTTLNVTWQVSAKNRLSVFGAYDNMCLCHFSISPTIAPEAATYNPGDSSIAQVRWTSTLTNRLLLEAGFSHYLSSFPREPQPDATEPSILEQSNNLRFRSDATYFPTPQTVDDYRLSLSYVTGAHSVKAGLTYSWQFAKDPTVFVIGDVNYRTLNGMPNQVTYYTTPYPTPLYLKPFGAFVQDQFTVKRLTLGGGLRFDQFRSSYNAIHIEPVRWLPVARDYPGAEVLNWKDLSPRVAASYDLLGNGKTAVKFSLARYVLQEGKGNTNSVHPVIAATNSVSRTWTDRNGDFIVQGDPLNPLLNEELGPSPNNNFGKPNTTLRFDPDWATGFGARPFNWEMLVTVQHELAPRVGLEVTYNRRSYGNFIVNDNTLVSPGRLRSLLHRRAGRRASSRRRRPADLRAVRSEERESGAWWTRCRTNSSVYGDQFERWNGLDVSLQARLQSGIMLQGGFSGGNQMTDNCDVVGKVDNPSPYLCHRESAFLPQVKLLGTYPLPWWGLQASGTFQSQISDPVGGANFDYNYFGLPANYVAGNAQISPSLGRNLSSGGTVTVNVVEPGTLYPDRTNQLDARLAKTFVMSGGRRLQALLDVYNVFNSNVALRLNGAYGSNGVGWGTPQAIVPGRLVKFGAQLRF